MPDEVTPIEKLECRLKVLQEAVHMLVKVQSDETKKELLRRIDRANIPNAPITIPQRPHEARNKAIAAASLHLIGIMLGRDPFKKPN